MPTHVIPRPSTLYQVTPSQDVDSRLMTARYAIEADIEDMATGYAPTPGLEERVRQFEAEYRQTYGIEAPQSVTLMGKLRAEHLKGKLCSKSS